MQLQPLDASVLSRNVMFDVSSRRPTDQSDFNTNASSFPPVTDSRSATTCLHPTRSMPSRAGSSVRS